MSETYARWFFAKRTLYPMERVYWMELNARWISEQEQAHPGFGTALRAVALEALAAGDGPGMRKALSALAVVGTAADLPALDHLAAKSGAVGKDAGAAAWEIRHREAAV